MKTILITSAACALLLAASGCSRKEEAGASSGSSSQSGVDAAGTLQTAVATAEAKTEVVKQKVEQATTNLQGQAAAATTQVQGLIDKAKQLLGEGKWSDARALLNQLTGQSLSPELQSSVQALKEQVEKAATAASVTVPSEPPPVSIPTIK
jgi:hypothetical protein